jgi:hypothetical protein
MTCVCFFWSRFKAAKPSQIFVTRRLSISPKPPQGTDEEELGAILTEEVKRGISNFVLLAVPGESPSMVQAISKLLIQILENKFLIMQCCFH